MTKIYFADLDRPKAKLHLVLSLGTSPIFLVLNMPSSDLKIQFRDQCVLLNIINAAWIVMHVVGVCKKKTTPTKMAQLLLTMTNSEIGVELLFLNSEQGKDQFSVFGFRSTTLPQNGTYY